MSEPSAPRVEEVEALVRALGAKPTTQALAELTAVANRAVIELHRLARQEANQRRGREEWGRWAKLANAVRSGVLQVAAIRDAVKGLQASPSPAPEGGDPAPPGARAPDS
jgi:hypothetical protein